VIYLCYRGEAKHNYKSLYDRYLKIEYMLIYNLYIRGNTMSKSIKASGEYTVKDTGEQVSYDFEYAVLDGSTSQEKINDAIELLGADKVAKDIQRMVKLDANNIAREKAKSANGHSTRATMTEEQKAEAKAKRQADKTLLDLIKSKGLSLSDIENI